MLIEVNKISVVKKRISDGSTVKNPLTSQNVKEEIKVVRECIRLDEIKSIRRWEKSRDEEIEIEGDVCMIYLIGDKTKEAAKMKVNESYDSLKHRLPVILVEEE